MRLPCHLHSTSQRGANTWHHLARPLAPHPLTFIESRWYSTGDLEGCSGGDTLGRKHAFQLWPWYCWDYVEGKLSSAHDSWWRRSEKQIEFLWCPTPFSALMPGALIVSSPSPPSLSYIKPLLGNDMKLTGIRCRWLIILVPFPLPPPHEILALIFGSQL